MSQLNVDTIKKADGTGSLTVPAETGTLVIKDGSNDVTLNDITAGGIYLGGTVAANYLDDYEEGTWTPSLGGTATYSVREAYYTKIGNLVFVNITMIIGSIGTGGTTALTGLPFTCRQGIAPAPVAYMTNGASNFYSVTGYVGNNSTSITMVGQTSLDGTLSTVLNIFGNSTYIEMSAVYTTD